MSRKLLQDMVKTRSERMERIPKKNDYSSSKLENDSEHNSFLEQNNNNGHKYGLWFIALFCVIFLFFAVSFLFSGATVTINPKTQDLALSQSLSAIKDTTIADTDNSNSSDLPFDLVTISGQETETVQGGEPKDIATEAKGTIVIYNAFSSSPQTFSADTKLEGSNGKIYKIEKKITVPGINSDGTPGSVEVGVYGSEVGEEYNSDPIDFKISAFKGTAKYSKYYARSKGPIAGGLKGKFSQISDDQKTAAINDLKNILQAKLLKKAADQIPEGYILFKDAVFLDDDGGNIGVVSQDNSSVPVTLTGTFYGFLFEEKKLTDKIIKENIPDYDGSDVYISNIRDLNFSLSDKENISFKDVANINFTLTGSAKVVWKVDPEKIISDLFGKKKSDFNQIMSGYTNISSADLVLKPAWVMSFPEKSKDIKVLVNYP